MRYQPSRSTYFARHMGALLGWRVWENHPGLNAHDMTHFVHGTDLDAIQRWVGPLPLVILPPVAA